MIVWIQKFQKCMCDTSRDILVNFHIYNLEYLLVKLFNTTVFSSDVDIVSNIIFCELHEFLRTTF